MEKCNEKHNGTTKARPTAQAAIFKLTASGTLVEQEQHISAVMARRAYELFEARGSEHGHDWEAWFRAESELLTPISTKVVDIDGGFTVRAQIPGFIGKDIEVQAEPRRLIIYGKKQGTSERREGRGVLKGKVPDEIFRVFDLPHEIDPEGYYQKWSDCGCGADLRNRTPQDCNRYSLHMELGGSMEERVKDRPSPNAKLVRVFDTEQETEAMVVRGLLESADIDCDVTSLDAQQDILPGVGGTVILVREEDAARAQRLIEEYRRVPGDDDAIESEVTGECHQT